MSVFVTDYSAIPWTVIHDELGHTGTIDPATIVHPKNMDGTTENHDFLIVTCPVCQAVSTHPVGGMEPRPLQHRDRGKSMIMLYWRAGYA